MSVWNAKANAVFLQAVEMSSSDQRVAFLDEACAGDPALRAEVEQLLKAHEEAGDFLQRPLLGDQQTQNLPGSTDGDDQPDPPEAGSDPISLDFLQRSDAPDSLGRLGQYEVREVVGRGGMGVVLKANDTKLNRIVAVKVLAPELASNAAARKRFVREARAAAAVSHDHVVRIYAVEDDELPYLAMEFIDGQSLQEKIDRQGQLSLREILRIGQQIAAGLAAAHGHGIIHRDIKPANVLLQNGIERVQITDFGLARAVDDVEITRPGEVAGTPQFMSPEQAQGQPVDSRSDLFSLGSVLYTMCTGRPPFRADTTVAVLRRICDDVPRPIREVNPDVPDWLVEIVDRLLAKQPEDRFETAAEVAELLGRHLAHVQDPDSTPFPGRLSAAERRRAGRARRRLWLAAALILLALVASLGISEATGVTRLTATVIRIATGEGTLVIEVDDPTVKVSIDGEQVPITGAGVEEVKLRPGQYRFKAIRDGRPLQEELVTITRGGRESVRVALEPPVPAQVDSAKMPTTDREAFPSPGSREAWSEADWNKAVELAPDDALPRIQRARWYAEQGEQEKADADFAKAAALAPKVGAAIDVAEVRFALGQAYWDSDRVPEAHRTWQEASRDLHRLATENPQDLVLQQRVASCEREFCRRYGALGLWDLAATLARHNAALKRLTDYRLDADFAVLLAVTEEQEPWREYCQHVVRQLPDKPSHEHNCARIVRTSCLLEPSAVDADECSRLASEWLGRQPADAYQLYFYQLCLALAQCRALRYDDAFRILEANALPSSSERPFSDGRSVQPSRLWGGYVHALAAEGDGSKEHALTQLERAEGLYQGVCRSALATDRKELPGSFDRYPWNIAAAQVLRREAWQKIKGEASPADPWWHLVQARGYGLLGESERAEREFAAAVAAAPDDPEIWMARARLFEQLGDAARAEAERNKTLELAPDDPLPWIQRARRYTEKGELDKAEADLVRAASLVPKGGAAIELGEVRLALGRLYWDSGRLPDAHRTWQQALRDLHQPATENPEDSAIQKRVTSCEQGICHYYGSMGLWDFALPKHAASFRSSSYNPYVRLLALNGQQEAWREYCQYYVAQIPPHPTHVQIACLLEPPAMDVEAWLASLQEPVGGGSDSTERFYLALAQCRASRYEEAEKTIETHPPFQSLDSISGTGSKPMAAYLLAIAAHGAGHAEKASGQIERADRLHQMLCQAALTTNQRQLPGNFAESWKTLVTVQVLRREAWQKTKGQSPPADPWWHLVQARGYALLGESERAEKEFAAAVAGVPDDPEVWIARARVFEQLGDAARAEADLNKTVELAPNDPLRWIERAVWHAEHGDHEKANADLAQAASLEPKAGSAIDVAKVRFALGQAYSDADRPQDAHQVWQAALADLDQLATQNPQDQALQEQVASLERQICRRAGGIGLWELATADPTTRPRPTPLPFDQWVDLLPRVDRECYLEGAWERDGDGLVKTSGSRTLLALPVEIDGSYDLQLDFAVISATPFWALGIPVGDTKCEVTFGSHRTRFDGIQRIDGRDVLQLVDGQPVIDNRNPTAREGLPFEAGDHSLLIQVRVKRDSASIDVSRDGKPYVSWKGKQAAISLREAGYFPRLEAKRPGLGLWGGVTSLNRLRIRPVSDSSLNP